VGSSCGPFLFRPAVQWPRVSGRALLH
jgi:hypothetical protein